METKEKIASAISYIESSTNFEIIAEIKAAMNSVYGEGRNQIIKPTVDTILEGLESHDAIVSKFLINAEQNSQVWIADYLKHYPFVINYQAIIHFPEITIKNSADKKHKITDIYVRFAIKPNGTICPSIQGMRATLTEAEYSSGYIHSHLRPFNGEKMRFSTFCTGVGEINQIMALLNSTYSSANIMMFLMHIKNFLEWESKEGTPYMHMENIFRRREYGNRLSSSGIERAADHLLKSAWKIDSSKIMDMLIFSLSEKSISIKPTATVERWLASEIQKWSINDTLNTIGCNISDALNVKDAEGRYHELPSNSSIRIRDNQKTILKFKGQEVKLRIIKQQETKNHETFANPKITEKFCEKLSLILTRTAITTPGIKSGNSLTYNTGASESDNIPVQASLDGRMVGDALL